MQTLGIQQWQKRLAAALKWHIVLQHDPHSRSTRLHLVTFSVHDSACSGNSILGLSYANDAAQTSWQNHSHIVLALPNSAKPNSCAECIDMMPERGSPPDGHTHAAECTAHWLCFGV
jgi:hypothetical protein